MLINKCIHYKECYTLYKRILFSIIIILDTNYRFRVPKNPCSKECLSLGYDNGATDRPATEILCSSIASGVELLAASAWTIPCTSSIVAWFEVTISSLTLTLPLLLKKTSLEGFILSTLLLIILQLTFPHNIRERECVLSECMSLS